MLFRVDKFLELSDRSFSQLHNVGLLRHRFRPHFCHCCDDLLLLGVGDNYRLLQGFGRATGAALLLALVVSDQER